MIVRIRRNASEKLLLEKANILSVFRASMGTY